MEKQFVEKLNLYDFLGFLLPGMVVLYPLYLTLNCLVGINFSFIPQASILITLIILVLGYLTGHIIAGLANVFEVWRNKKKFNGYPSDMLLRKDKEYIQRFKRNVKEYFGLSDNTKENLFSLAYGFLVQNAVPGHYNIFNALYGLYRGLAFACLIVALLSTILLFKQIQVPIAWTLLLFAITCGWVFLNRYDRFGNYFAIDVVRGFNIYIASQKHNQK